MIATKTIEQIIIEACKGNTADVSLKEVYAASYFQDGTEQEYFKHMANILGKIRDKYIPVDVFNLLSELGPENDWKFEEGASYWEKVVISHTSAIRLTEVTAFGDMFGYE